MEGVQGGRRKAPDPAWAGRPHKQSCSLHSLLPLDCCAPASHASAPVVARTIVRSRCLGCCASLLHAPPLTLTLTHTHTHTHTHTLSHTLSHTLTHTHTHTRSHTQPVASSSSWAASLSVSWRSSRRRPPVWASPLSPSRSTWTPRRRSAPVV